MIDQPLRGKVAIVTGAGHGLGAAHALALAAAGAAVVINDAGVGFSGMGVVEPRAETMAKRIRDEGGQAAAAPTDCADWRSAEAMVKLAISEFGRLDILVLNAAITRLSVVSKMTEADWDDVIRVNLKGTFAPAHFACAYWEEEARQGREIAGRIITTSSKVAFYPGLEVGSAVYAASKAGIIGFMRTLSEEMRAIGVTVNALLPSAATGDGFPATVGDVSLFSPDQVAPLVVYLASDRARGITGRVFHAGGGSFATFGGWRFKGAIDSTKHLTLADFADAFDRGFAGEELPTLADISPFSRALTDKL